MSIWKRVGDAWGSWWYQGVNFGGDEGVYVGGDTGNYDNITVENALKLSAVWACVNLRASTTASLPLHLRKGRDLATGESVYRILHDAPNADMTASEYWESQAAKVDLEGNAYSLIHTMGNRLTALEPLQEMEPFRRKNGEIAYRINDEEFHADKILHLKGFTLDGVKGLSKLEYARQMIGGQLEANASAERMFRQSMKVGGFLKTGAQTLSDEQRARLRKGLAEFGKSENAGKYMVLEAGVEPVSGASMRISPADAQLIESRYFGIEEVCRFFGVPPQMIGHTDKASSWASSLEGMNRGFLQYSLRPDLVRFEQQINRKLLTPEQRADGFRAKFSVEGLLRADYQQRIQGYASALQNGWMNRNEVRNLEDMPPIENGGDDYTVQLNLVPVDQLNGGGAATQKETE